MPRPRAADDFPMIRSRMVELRQVTRPRAADDFTAIRARLEELRRERNQIEADQKGRSPIGPKPYHRAASSGRETEDDRRLPRPFREICG
jgi:hypothetical protein